MLTPSTAETKIIQSLIAEKLGLGSPFLKQIPVLRFPTRYMTGTGYFMEFDPLPESLRAEPENTVLSTDFGTKLPSPRATTATADRANGPATTRATTPRMSSIPTATTSRS